MPRIARNIIPDIPYHVTQRGNRRQDVFFSDGERERYLEWMKDYSERYELEILAYCLMTNHIHLVAIPHSFDSLARTLCVVHTRHSQSVNKSLGWSGHLWQGKYYSTALDEAHLWAAIRYVERNPVRAGMVSSAEEYHWSSAAFHVGLRPDRLIKSDSQWGRTIENWRNELSVDDDTDMLETLRTRTHTGYPCGDESFINKISEILGRPIILRPQGRPKKAR